jgi:hypothetical protein
LLKEWCTILLEKFSFQLRKNEVFEHINISGPRYGSLREKKVSVETKCRLDEIYGISRDNTRGTLLSQIVKVYVDLLGLVSLGYISRLQKYDALKYRTHFINTLYLSYTTSRLSVSVL